MLKCFLAATFLFMGLAQAQIISYPPVVPNRPHGGLHAETGTTTNTGNPDITISHLTLIAWDVD